MFLGWVKDKRFLRREEVGTERLGIELTCHEYVGAVSDFTGELGRMAVNMASRRDMGGVREIHEVTMVVVKAMSALCLNERFGQKFKAMNGNLLKMEDLIYELSMMQKTGNSRPKSLDVDSGADKTGAANDEEDL